MLILAALYTYARYNNHDISDILNTPTCLQPVFDTKKDEAEGATEGTAEASSSSLDDSTDSSNNSNNSSDVNEQRRRHLHRLQRRVSDTFQSARHQTNSLLQTTVGRCTNSHPSSSTSDYYSNTPGTAATRATTAAAAAGEASSSSLYASIPLQGSSTYSLLADHPGNMESSNTDSGANSSATSHNVVPVEDVSLNMFPQSVREEWINAVFGRAFCNNKGQQQEQQKSSTTSSNNLSPQHGVGHAGIASYTSYTTTIPIPQQQPQQNSNTTMSPAAAAAAAAAPAPPPVVAKVGITISRLPLGVYVRRIAPMSEAALLGVQVGDVLVSVNGLKVLAEPSRPLLERLWQYEGVNSSSSDVVSSTTIPVPSNSNSIINSRRQSQTDTTSESNNNAAAGAHVLESGSSNNNSNNGAMTGPVAMVFSRRGQLHQVLFLSSSGGSSSCSGWGMAWAPCGNFPLVKRSYGLAAAAGVQRGSILASVNNGKTTAASFRDCDHYEMAMKLSRDFQAGGNGEQQDLQLTLCFPPRAARPQRVNSQSPQPQSHATTTSSTSTTPQTRPSSSSYNASVPRKRAPQPKRVLRMDDGVEIKFHSLEFALGGICNAAVAGRSYNSTPSPPQQQARNHHGSSNNSISDLAERVAAGAVESPFVKDIISASSSLSWRQQVYYSPCPTLQGKELLDAWNPLESLLYCCAFYKTGYQEDALQDFLQDNNQGVLHDNHDGSSSSSCSSSTVAALHALMNTQHAAPMASAFLLQFISVICSPSSSSSGAAQQQQSLVTTTTTAEEKKSDDLLIVHDESLEIINKYHHDTIAKELTSMLLKLSRRDEGFCQRLYFLLRSYISSMETKRQGTTTTSTTKTSGNGMDGSSSTTTHLMALLKCLELLRFAEKRLAGGHYNSNANDRLHAPIPSSLSVSPATSHVVATNKTPMESPVPNAVPASPASSASAEEAAATAAANKKKSVLHFLRKKKPSATTNSKPGTSSSFKLHPSNSRKISMVSPLGDHVGQEMAMQPQPPKLKSNTTTVAVVTPTLSSSQQRQQQYYSMSSIMSNDVSLSQSPSVMYENMTDFLSQLDQICSTIERSLQRSFRQKIADWAMQPWSASKDTALASVTSAMRQTLKQANDNDNNSDDSQYRSRMKLLVNPVESSELLSSVDADECYILPSAHFPILLTFNVSERRSSDYSPAGEERMYRTTVKLRGLRNGSGAERPQSSSLSYTVHAAVAGKILASDESHSIDYSAAKHAWCSGNDTLVFDTRSSWGAPQTLSLRLSSSVLANPAGAASPSEDATFGWIDLSQLWKECDYSNSQKSVKCQVSMLSLEARDELLDEHGESADQEHGQQNNGMELEVEVSTEFVDFGDASNGDFSRKRMLLYKHDDDLRQDDFAVQFIRTCDNILKASGLDMKLLTFQCIPVGTRRGFVEWVPGSVPLSEVCQPFLDSFLESADNKATASDDDRDSPSMFAKAGLTKYESLFRLGGSLQNESLRRLAGAATSASVEKPGSFANNPVQDYLRSVAYAEDAPYLIRRDVMDTYVKSCAGYSVITYILGVGDRHLDNLLLHQSGSFFHCDYSFILGSDPKKYLPMRMTEDMVNGMGGRSSDNYAKFLSLTCAAFLALRRPETVRILLSMVRLTECSNLPDMTENQSIDQSILGLRDRLRLDVREDEAVAFMENLIEESLNSKLWLAVDAIHSLGKKF